MFKQCLVASALIAVVVPHVAGAASLDGPRVQSYSKAGVFAGPRAHFSFGGTSRTRLRGGFVLTGMQTTLRIDGSQRTRFGEGLWLGMSDHGQPALSIAGRPVGDALDGKRRNTLSKRGTAAALVVGGVLVVALVGYLYLDHAVDNEDE